MSTTTTLYQLAKTYHDEAIGEVFSENDLICVINDKQMPYYVNIEDNAFAAYRGEKGLSGYLALSLTPEEEEFSLDHMDLEHQQDCLFMIGEQTLADLELADQEAIKKSSVDFSQGFFPQFRSKAQYAYPVPVTAEEEQDLILIFRALLYAKEYFAKFKKKSKTNSFFSWLEEQNLEDIEGQEYFPTLIAEGGSFAVSAKLLEDDAYGFYYPQAFFTDEEKQVYYKRLKPKVGKILYIAIGVMPYPVLSEKDKKIVFPMYQVVYDPQTDEILDLFMVEDYDQEHGKFIARLLEIFDDVYKPQAIHCYGKRTMALLSKIGKQIGIMVVEGVDNEMMHPLLMEMFHELSAEHHHEHEHGPDCGCHHHDE